MNDYQTGNCPKCAREHAHVEMVTIPMQAANQNTYEGVAYVCPSCRAILSIGFDPRVVLDTRRM